jgi:REP element-mobilizing transposase RayT
MPRRIRIIPGELTSLEIIPRTRESLPFPPCKTSNALLQGILARTQRDEKVELCHFVSMNSHFHLHVLPKKEPHQVCNFYGELQKKMTDTLRTLLGKSHLRLWEDRTSVIHVETLEDMVDRLVYIYTNPSVAGLCNSISEYPGLSSWEAFTTCSPSIEAVFEVNVFWFPLRCLEPLPEDKRLMPEQDASYLESLMRHRKKVPSSYQIKPFLWLKRYGISDVTEIEKIRQTVISRVQEVEAQLRAERQSPCASPQRLQSAQFHTPHTPKKLPNSTKVFLICKDKKRRNSILSCFRDVIRRYRTLYEDARRGIKDLCWPPGTCIPWLPATEGLAHIAH